MTTIDSTPHEKGPLKVWTLPPENNEYTNRYVVSVDTGEAYKTSDYTSIRVFDRLPMVFGGDPKIVAHWWGHADHHTITWQAERRNLRWEEVLLDVLCAPAPRLYITLSSARNLFYKLINKKK